MRTGAPRPGGPPSSTILNAGGKQICGELHIFPSKKKDGTFGFGATQGVKTYPPNPMNTFDNLDGPAVEHSLGIGCMGICIQLATGNDLDGLDARCSLGMGVHWA